MICGVLGGTTSGCGVVYLGATPPNSNNPDAPSCALRTSRHFHDFALKRSIIAKARKPVRWVFVDWHSFTGPVFDVLPRYRHFRVHSPQFELKSASAPTQPQN